MKTDGQGVVDEALTVGSDRASEPRRAALSPWVWPRFASAAAMVAMTFAIGNSAGGGGHYWLDRSVIAIAAFGAAAANSTSGTASIVLTAVIAVVVFAWAIESIAWIRRVRRQMQQDQDDLDHLARLIAETTELRP